MCSADCFGATSGCSDCSGYINGGMRKMRQVDLSEEVYEQLKSFIVDPFEDTVESVIGRLVDITNKARDCWPDLQAANLGGRDEELVVSDGQTAIDTTSVL